MAFNVAPISTFAAPPRLALHLSHWKKPAVALAGTASATRKNQALRLGRAFGHWDPA